MDELSLIVFTVCMQAAIGTIVLKMIAKYFSKEQEFKLATTIAAILSIVGVLASLFHLGTPTLALNSLLNLGSSWLSREVLFSGMFMGIVVIYAILVYVKPEANSLLNIFGWAAGLVGLVDVFFMAKVYTFSSVSAWQGWLAFIEFFAATVIFGVSIMLVTSIKSLDKRLLRYFGLGVIIVLGVQVAFAFPYYVNLGLMGGAGAVSLGILQDLNILLIIQWLLLIFGSGFLLFTKLSRERGNLARYYVIATALGTGLAIGRYLFYAISIASEVGLS